MPAMWSRRQRRARVFRVRKEPTMSSRFGRGTGEVRTLSHLIDVLAEHGDRQAVLALQREGTESWSYEGLAEYARRLARGLTEAGVGRGDHVMLFAPSRPEWMVACLAIVEAGAVVTPVDVQIGEEALGRILDHSDARFVFTTTDQTEKLERLDLGDIPRHILLDVGEEDPRSWRHLLAGAERDADPWRPDPNE